MQTLSEIETIVKTFSDAREKVSERVRSYEADLAELKKRHLRGIKQAALNATEKESVLRAAIENSPALFESPRAFTMHGVKFGFQKQKGSITFEDEDKVISLIHKNFPELADSLIKSDEKLLKTSLAWSR